MHFSSIHFTAIIASLCLVQGAPVATTPGLPPLLKSTPANSIDSLYASCTAVTSVQATSTTATKKSSTSTSTTKATSTTTRSTTSSSSTIKTTSTTTRATTSSSSSYVAPITTTKLVPVSTPTSIASNNKSSSCFPSIGHKMPSSVPSSTNGWWCDQEDEYAFLGFSYSIYDCQSQSQLNREFLDAKNRFNARYIRLYGTCDTAGYYDKVIAAAWNAGIGVHAIIWFGFDGDTSYIGRQADLFKSLTTNPKAPFVTRGVQFGSEPLFDWAIDPNTLAKQVLLAKKTLAPYGIPLTVSELAWGFTSRLSDGSQNVLNALDYVSLGMLPYFSQNAQSGGKAWSNNMYDMNQILGLTKSSKKIIWTQTGWPSVKSCPGVCPNSATAVSSVASEAAYFNLLDSMCTTMKTFPQGGVGWFAHVYSDSQLPGYGILDSSGNLKFNFAPRIAC